MQNIAHLCTRDRSRTWGKDGWKKVRCRARAFQYSHSQVVVCVVADGRMKLNARTRSVLAALGVYQDGVAKNVVNGKPVVSRHGRQHADFNDRLGGSRLRVHNTTLVPRLCSHALLTGSSDDRQRGEDQARRLADGANSDDLLLEGE